MALTHSEHLSTLGGANPRDGGSTTHNHTQTTPLAHSSQHTIAPHIQAVHPPRHPRFITAHCHPHAPTHPRRAPHTHLRWWVNARTATHTTPTRTQQPAHHRTSHTGSSAWEPPPHGLSPHARDVSPPPQHLPAHPRIRDESAHSLVLTMPHSRTGANTPSHLIY